MNVAISNILTPKPDLVVSGINRGYNLGYSAYLSGTVGAARQGAMLGVPSIATSLAEAGTQRDYVFAAEEVLGVARRVKQWGLPPNTFLNVNIPVMPAEGYKGYMITTQAHAAGRQGTLRRDEASLRPVDLLEPVRRRRHRPARHGHLGGVERLRLGHADEDR